MRIVGNILEAEKQMDVGTVTELTDQRKQKPKLAGGKVNREQANFLCKTQKGSRTGAQLCWKAGWQTAGLGVCVRSRDSASQQA